MTVRRLYPDTTWGGSTGDHEYVHVILEGRCAIRTTQGDFLNVGSRPDVFSGLPFALYLSRGVDFEIKALTENFECASCWVATDQDHPAKLVTPADVTVDLRGGGNASRQVVNIIPPGFGCQHIVCVEAYIPGGNWAGYPPHKHDVHRQDAAGKLLEADLEEIYFYKINPAQGYALQRIYNERYDQTFLAQHNDTILIHEGYHPTVTPAICLIFWQVQHSHSPVAMTLTTLGSNKRGVNLILVCRLSEQNSS